MNLINEEEKSFFGLFAFSNKKYLQQPPKGCRNGGYGKKSEKSIL